jgi:hypothetical protein
MSPHEVLLLRDVLIYRDENVKACRFRGIKETTIR